MKFVQRTKINYLLVISITIFLSWAFFSKNENKFVTATNNSIESVNVNKLQKEVWGHSSELETHTVETHIYRLRKKISKTFNDQDFIISKKNGYKIKKEK